LRQQFGHAGEEQILVHPLPREIVPVGFDRPPRLPFIESIELCETLMQGRADERAQTFPVGLIDAKVCQGVLHRPGDPLGRIGQGAIEIEEDDPVRHPATPRRHIRAQP